MKKKIYVASSFKNEKQPHVVSILEKEGYDVYDFRNPKDITYHWSDVDPNYKTWNATKFKKALDHPLVTAGFNSDFEALNACDVCVLVLPCNRSSHLELGYAIGQSKHSIILLENRNEPEAMYKMVDLLTTDLEELVKWLEELWPRI